MAQLFAAEGTAICVADMDKERADKVAGEIVGRGGRAIATALDVCQAGQWEQAVVAVRIQSIIIILLSSNTALAFACLSTESKKHVGSFVVAGHFYSHYYTCSRACAEIGNAHIFDGVFIAHCAMQRQMLLCGQPVPPVK